MAALVRKGCLELGHVQKIEWLVFGQAAGTCPKAVGSGQPGKARRLALTTPRRADGLAKSLCRAEAGRPAADRLMPKGADVSLQRRPADFANGIRAKPDGSAAFLAAEAQLAGPLRPELCGSQAEAHVHIPNTEKQRPPPARSS